MAFPKNIRTSHGGAKNSSSKDGWWGTRAEAKRYARRERRRVDGLAGAVAGLPEDEAAQLAADELRAYRDSRGHAA